MELLILYTLVGIMAGSLIVLIHAHIKLHLAYKNFHRGVSKALDRIDLRKKQ